MNPRRPDVAQRWSKVERATTPRFVSLLHLLHLLHPPIGVAGGGGATNPLHTTWTFVRCNACARSVGETNPAGWSKDWEQRGRGEYNNALLRRQEEKYIAGS